MSKNSRPRSSNYRKPPVEHQFKKGKSGNPNGRPKKKDPKPGPAGLGGGIADRFAGMALDEATRPVKVREGDKTSKIPAMQALIRAMFRAAAEGDTKAGRQLLDLITRAESERTGVALHMLKEVVEYKRKFGPIFEQHERLGRDPPDIYPHPDDIIIDDASGEVTFDGPDSKEQAGSQKAIRQHALETMGRYFEVEAALAKDPANRELKLEYNDLKKYQDFLKRDSERTARHEARRQARRAFETPKKLEDDGSDQ
jgi:hypothetical protein